MIINWKLKTTQQEIRIKKEEIEKNQSQTKIKKQMKSIIVYFNNTRAG